MMAVCEEVCFWSSCYVVISVVMIWGNLLELDIIDAESMPRYYLPSYLTELCCVTLKYIVTQSCLTRLSSWKCSV